MNNYSTYLLDLCHRGTIILWPKIKDKALQIVQHCGLFDGVLPFFVLSYHFGPLYNIIAYKQSQCNATYLSVQDLCST